MKDSQQIDNAETGQAKYIKANNERFSTLIDLYIGPA